MKTVYSGGEAEIVEKKSRFIATVRPVSSEEEAVAFIAEMKKKYWDARHNCSAFVIGDRQEMSRCSDDGEPAQTAGRPMLDVLLREDIHNVAVVVTRYFGGVLLGTGGLIRAYQAASKAGLEIAETAVVSSGITAVIVTDYNVYGKLQYICNDIGVDIMDTDFGADVTIKLAAAEEKAGILEKRITDAFSGNVVMEDKKNVKFCKKSSGEIIIL